jgi:hypothetical protein
MYPTNVGAANVTQTAAAAGSSMRAPNNPPLTTKPVTLSPRHPALVASWNAGKGGAALSSITQQLGTVLMAHGASQYPIMRRACVQLSASVETASGSEPIPDATMEQLYQRALTLLAAGAGKCEAGISTQKEGLEDTATRANASLLSQAMSDFSTGSRDLYSATATIRVLKKN